MSDESVWRSLFPGTSVTIESDDGKDAIAVHISPCRVEQLPDLATVIKDILERRKVDLGSVKGIKDLDFLSIIGDLMEDFRVIRMVSECCSPGILDAPHHVVARVLPIWMDETFFRSGRMQAWTKALEKATGKVPTTTSRNSTSRPPSASSSKRDTAKRRS